MSASSSAAPSHDRTDVRGPPTGGRGPRAPRAPGRGPGDDRRRARRPPPRRPPHALAGARARARDATHRGERRSGRGPLARCPRPRSVPRGRRTARPPGSMRAPSDPRGRDPGGHAPSTTANPCAATPTCTEATATSTSSPASTGSIGTSARAWIRSRGVWTQTASPSGHVSTRPRRYTIIGAAGGPACGGYHRARCPARTRWSPWSGC